MVLNGLGFTYQALYLLVMASPGARTQLSTAIELYRTMDMTFWLSHAEVELVQVA
jgi:hypothetical protein